ncbi:MAG: 1,4-alpha-glucan branching enzyme GlgB [Verrucomicrobiae bacterium]|nr:1,4-alpha-glucan branching enzyme GlgB [Verrucomicrobiae bacterium]
MARSKSVTFILDAPQANTVAVAGTFNDWDATRAPLAKNKNGRWKVKLSLPTGRHEYRFVVDGQWISDPAAIESAANPHGSDNSVVVV